MNKLTHILIICASNKLMSYSIQAAKKTLEKNLIYFANFLTDNVFLVEGLSKEQYRELQNCGSEFIYTEFDFDKTDIYLSSNKIEKYIIAKNRNEKSQ